MPIFPPAIAGILAKHMIASGVKGIDVPKLSLGIANSLAKWVPTIVVQTVDTGTLGAGKGTPTPILVPQPALYANLLAGDTAQGLIGILSPVFTLGIANGLVESFLLMLTNTAHPGTGVGAGVATFRASPASLAFLEQFPLAGIIGIDMPRKANAIGLGLDITFASLVLPVAITGPASPTAGGGSGVGNII